MLHRKRERDRLELKGARFTVHPLFLLAGVLSAFTGALPLFLAATVAAVEHECAHAFAARRYGFSLDRIVLMPYGAVVKGDIAGIGKKQEIAVLLSGPLANLATGFLFVALWWLWPETYPYTDIAAYVSFSLFFVNLLPAFPLDGGRLLRVALSPLGERRARIIGIAVNAALAAGIFAYFVASCFQTPAFSALAFSVLLAAGAAGGGSYRPLFFSRRKSFARGVEEMRIALSADCTVREALRFVREDRYLTLLLFDGETFFGELTEEEYLAALARGDYARKLRECMANC